MSYKYWNCYEHGRSTPRHAQTLTQAIADVETEISLAPSLDPEGWRIQGPGTVEMLLDEAKALLNWLR